MALPSIDVPIIKQGAMCNVQITNADDTKSVVGLVQNASYSEDYNVVSAQVLGFWGDVSIDAQGYVCNVTIGTYVPFNKDSDEAYLDGGTTTINSKVYNTASGFRNLNICCACILISEGLKAF